MTELENKVKSGFNSSARQSNASFLRLPAELRAMVYAYALGCNTWSISMSGGQAKPHADNAVKHALALLRVSRQIYAEAYLFPYRYNTFEGRHNGHLREWIQSLSAARRESITCIKRYQRSYLIQGAHSVDVSPIFWMDAPSMTQWELKGLKRIEIEVALHEWGWGINEAEAKAAKKVVLAKLCKLVEDEHPGVMVDVALRRGY